MWIYMFWTSNRFQMEKPFYSCWEKGPYEQDLFWLRNKNTVLLWILWTFEELNRSIFFFLLLPTFIPYFKSISIKKITIYRLGINTIQIRSHLVSIINILLVWNNSKFEEMCLSFGCLHLILLLMSFNSISNDKLAIFLLGIRTISIGTQ
jgi:hypothetical protein